MAVINVTPITDITALIASDSVNEGDVLLLEEGIYFQTVNIQKNNIRITAKGPGVIFDGKSILIAAFTLSNVTGVGIEGIKIRHYRVNGILIQSGSGNRIVNNRIVNVLDDGIEVIGSGANLIWKNEVCNCLEGIKLTLGSANNWVIENIVKECINDGFETTFSFDSNNAFISNIAIGNRGSALGIFGSNNLVLGNIIDNTRGTFFHDGGHSLAIENNIRGSKFGAIETIGPYRNLFAGGNHIECNRSEGIVTVTEFGMFLNNEILYNGDFGISFFTPSAVGNLVMDNELVCNIPVNINDRGVNDSFINNIEKPCEPCESPSDACGECFEGGSL